jgi:hypothetical protein
MSSTNESTDMLPEHSKGHPSVAQLLAVQERAALDTADYKLDDPLAIIEMRGFERTQHAHVYRKLRFLEEHCQKSENGVII